MVDDSDVEGETLSCAVGDAVRLRERMSPEKLLDGVSEGRVCEAEGLDVPVDVALLSCAVRLADIELERVDDGDDVSERDAVGAGDTEEERDPLVDCDADVLPAGVTVSDCVGEAALADSDLDTSLVEERESDAEFELLTVALLSGVAEEVVDADVCPVSLRDSVPNECVPEVCVRERLSEKVSDLVFDQATVAEVVRVLDS